MLTQIEISPVEFIIAQMAGISHEDKKRIALTDTNIELILDCGESMKNDNFPNGQEIAKKFSDRLTEELSSQE